MFDRLALLNAFFLKSKECENSNPKVRQASISLLEEIYIQIGPPIKALIQSLLPDNITSSLKNQIEKVFDSTFDPSASKVIRTKSCITLAPINFSKKGSVQEDQLQIEIPKTDLVASLPENCMTRLVRLHR